MKLPAALIALLSLLASAGLAQPAESAPDPARPTIFIAGDSTAARGRGESQQGWGEPFAAYFDPTKVNIVNRARGGRSSRTFLNEGLWDRLIAEVKSGDMVLIQFGHNDGGPINERPARGSLPGIGEETQDIVRASDNQPETVHTFGWYLRKYIADVKARGAQPIVLSLTVRNLWAEGKVERGSGRFSPWAWIVARDAAVPFIDLMNLAADQFDAMGAEKMAALYPQDHTHFNATAADLHAATVVAGLKGLRLEPVAGYLSAKGQEVAAENTAWLRLARPANPKLPNLILVGDSTVRNGRGDGVDGQWGWGDFIAPYFDTEKINLVNRAVGGTGARSFRNPGGHWEHALALTKPGDVVMIQFGHNDNGARGPLRGVGEETEPRPNPRTNETETVHTFGWYLRQYITEVRAKGATPIVCSLVPRKIWQDGKLARQQDSHAGWAEQVATQERALFLNLNELIAARYDALGITQVEPLFADARTHTSREGAILSAAIVAEGLRALPENPLTEYLLVK